MNPPLPIPKINEDVPIENLKKLIDEVKDLGYGKVVLEVTIQKGHVVGMSLSRSYSIKIEGL